MSNHRFQVGRDRRRKAKKMGIPKLSHGQGVTQHACERACQRVKSNLSLSLGALKKILKYDSPLVKKSYKGRKEIIFKKGDKVYCVIAKFKGHKPVKIITIWELEEPKC